MTEKLMCELEQTQGEFKLTAEFSLPLTGVTALYGPSGSGKTTLIRLIAGLDRPELGFIHFGNKTLCDTNKSCFIPPQKRNFGIVFQEPRLFPHLSVRKNLTYAMASGAKKLFAEIVDLLGLDTLLNRFPNTLSGGEAKRVAIGRALLSQPKLLLLDEPLNGLDGQRKSDFLRFLTQLIKKIQIPVIYVSHDPKEILSIADYLIMLERGQILASGPIDDLLSQIELTPKLGGFEAASRLHGRVESHNADYQLTRLDIGASDLLTVSHVNIAIGEPVTVTISAKEVAISLTRPLQSSYRNILEAEIEQIESSNVEPSANEVVLKLGTQKLRTRLTKQATDELALQVGQSVFALIRSVSITT